MPGGRGLVILRFAVIEFPYWFLALLTSAPLVRKVKIRRPRRANEGASVCPSCAYDLRASPERCPECGAAKADCGQHTAASTEQLPL